MARPFEIGELRKALSSLRGAITVVILLSAALNVLLLGGSLYMMMIYDSVFPSQSIPTLVRLLVIVVIVYAAQGVFDAFRSRMLNDIALSFDRRLSARVQDAAFTARLHAVGNPVATIDRGPRSRHDPGFS